MCEARPVVVVDEVVELDVPWIPDPGVPSPVYWHNDQRFVVAYRTAPVAAGGPIAMLEFDTCLQARVGYPNDEAVPGHPLYDSGLRYGIFEVRQPSWLEQLKSQNAKAKPEAAHWWPIGAYRHFVITFHDNALEVLAKEMRGVFLAQWPAMVSLETGPETQA